MKTLITILALFVTIVATAQQLKYESYEFDSYEDLISTLTDEGFTFTNPLPMDSQIYDTVNNQRLGFHYMGNIVINYPKIYDTIPNNPIWTPEYSTEVYIICARKGNTKLPSNKKVTGQMRKYIWQYIVRFYGETNQYDE